MAFIFENLDVYQLSLNWVHQATQIASALKGTFHAPLADQLIRASTSISLNIAEGNGRWHIADKKQFLWIARGSVFECVAIVQATSQQKAFPREVYDKAYETLEGLSKMLTKLIQSVETMRRGERKDVARPNGVAPVAAT
jgi:four helix bundle protein